MKLVSQNTKFNYLYRDAGNYKSWGDVIFANPDYLPLNEIEKRLTKAFDQEIFFIANQINVNEIFFKEITDDDHCYHEFYSVELTERNASDLLNRTIKNFIEQVESEALYKWRIFDPMGRHLTSILKSIKKQTT